MPISTEILNNAAKDIFCKQLGIEEYKISPYSQEQPHLNKEMKDIRQAFLSDDKELSKMFYPFKIEFKHNGKWNYFYLEADTETTRYSIPFASGTDTHYDISSMEEKAIAIIKRFTDG